MSWQSGSNRREQERAAEQKQKDSEFHSPQMKNKGYDIGFSEGYREGRILENLELLVNITRCHEQEHPSEQGEIDLIDYLLPDAEIYWEEAYPTIKKYPNYSSEHLAKKIFFESTYLLPRELLDHKRIREACKDQNQGQDK